MMFDVADVPLISRAREIRKNDSEGKKGDMGSYQGYKLRQYDWNDMSSGLRAWPYFSLVEVS